MKLLIQVRGVSHSSEHVIEFAASAALKGGSSFHYLVDGKPGQADWSEVAPGVYSILLDGTSREARLLPDPARRLDGAKAYNVVTGLEEFHLEVRDPRFIRGTGVQSGGEGPREITAPMPGKVVKILVTENQDVRDGQGLLVVEAMKMQNEIHAPRRGRVQKIHVSEGCGVEAGAPLLRLE